MLEEKEKKPEEKKKKFRRSKNYSTNIYSRAAEVDPLATVGASAMGFPDKISPVRGVMETRHAAQRVVLENPEFARVFTGAENPFGHRSSYDRKADDDYEVMKIFKKFKDFENSEIVYVLRNIHTGRYTCEIYEWAHHNVEKYGFRMVNHLQNKHEGDFIAKGETLQQSTSYQDDNYCGGVNARILYTVLPELTEDSLVISTDLAKRLEYNMVDMVKVNLNKNSFLLNTYGDDSLYKSFPNIGEEIKDDVLLSIRENSIVSSKKEAKISHINDQDKISHGIVIDIDIYSNVEVENDQFNYYKKCCEDYYQSIYAYISTIVEDPAQDDNGIIDLYHRAEKYLSEAVWVTKENVLDTEIRFKILQPMKIAEGQKVVGRYGNKSVISKIIPTHLMPRTEDGRPLDMVANGLSINNRIIFFALYESTITFMCERMHQHAIKMYNEGYSSDDIMAPIVEFCSLFNETWGSEISRLYRLNPAEGIKDVIDNGIYIHIPPLGKESTRDAILQAYEKFPDIFEPYELFTKLRHRWLSRGKHAIGYQYTWVLKQEPSKAMSAVATARTTLYDQPVKTKQFNKNNARRYSDNPIKFGEYDTYNFLAGISVVDFSKISTYFRGSQYEENSILMSALNNVPIDTNKYNTFPQLDQLKNILKFFGEKLEPGKFHYGTIGCRDDVREIYFNNVPVNISVTELRHILIIYSYFIQFRNAKMGIMDMAEFYNDMYNHDELFQGYDMQYREYILHKFANMIPILDQIKTY